MKKNMNIVKGWELIDEDRFTWAKEHKDGHYSFIGLKEISNDDDFFIQKGEYDSIDELATNEWGVFLAVHEEGYGLCPDYYMTREEWLENLEQNYGNNIELVIDKCLFWQDFCNINICNIHGWDRACTKIRGLLEIM